MDEKNKHPETLVLLFDGVCNLCNGAVRFFVKRDPRKRLRFASLQSATGQRILTENGLPVDHLSSIVLVDRSQTHLNSAAVLHAFGYLRFPWPSVKIFLLIPRFCRDWIYKWIARNRYRWFGERDDCPLPNPEDADRFL